MTELYLFPDMASERVYPDAHITVTDFTGDGITVNFWGDPYDADTGTMILLSAPEAKWLADRVSEALESSRRGQEYGINLP
jgi:hypothetical protein